MYMGGIQGAADILPDAQNAISEGEGPHVHGLYLKLLVVWVRYMGHECRTSFKYGKDRDKDDQVFSLRKRTGLEAIGDVKRMCRLRWHGHV